MKGSITKIPEDKYFQNFDIRREGSLTNVFVFWLSIQVKLSDLSMLGKGVEVRGDLIFHCGEEETKHWRFRDPVFIK